MKGASAPIRFVNSWLMSVCVFMSLGLIQRSSRPWLGKAL
jgi:hypothetical protein